MNDSNLTKTELASEAESSLSEFSFSSPPAPAASAISTAETQVSVELDEVLRTSDQTTLSNSFEQLRTEQFVGLMQQCAAVRDVIQEVSLAAFSGRAGDEKVRLARDLTKHVSEVRNQFDELVTAAEGLRGIDEEVLIAFRGSAARIETTCSLHLKKEASEPGSTHNLLDAFKTAVPGNWSQVRREAAVLDLTTETVVALAEKAQSFSDLVEIYGQFVEGNSDIHANLVSWDPDNSVSPTHRVNLQRRGLDTPLARQAAELLATFFPEEKAPEITITGVQAGALISIREGNDRTRMTVGRTAADAPIEVHYCTSGVGSVLAVQELESVTYVAPTRGIAVGRISISPAEGLDGLAECLDSITRARAIRG